MDDCVCHVVLPFIFNRLSHLLLFSMMPKIYPPSLFDTRTIRLIVNFLTDKVVRIQSLRKSLTKSDRHIFEEDFLMNYNGPNYFAV